jgi:uncharacterized protein VirK/YbjX
MEVEKSLRCNDPTPNLYNGSNWLYAWMMKTGTTGIWHFLAAGRIFMFPQQLARLFLLRFLWPYFSHAQKPEPFFFLTHEFYLSRHFTLAQRVDSAVGHYSQEAKNCGSAYHDAVYRSPEGLILWSRVVHGKKYTLILRATEDHRKEGDLSILCLVNDIRVCRLSFAFVPGSLFDLDEKATMFITRNQTDRGSELQLFREHFKQNSPPYFCLAAACGIAMAHGLRNICLINDQAQVAYDQRFQTSFRNSYSEFWRGFGAAEIVERQAYKITLPLALSRIATVKHKSRAIARRQNWLEIMVNARQVILQHRLTRSPSPIDFDTAELLPSPPLSPPAPARPNGSETLRLDP